MLRINRIFYQNEKYGFKDELIEQFFPKDARTFDHISFLETGEEVWFAYQPPSAKWIRGYARGVFLSYKKPKPGAYMVTIETAYYGTHRIAVLKTVRRGRLFKLESLHEGLLVGLAERHPLTTIPMA